jgi:uncharacterized protein (TIGR03435 family)
MLRLIAIIVAFCCQGRAQTDFEAASVKVAVPAPLPPGRPAPGTPGMHGGLPQASMRGGPGSTDPGSIVYRNVTLRDVVLKAYGVASFQVSAPAWFDTDRFEIQAKLPPNTTKSDFEVMLQHLLAQRFHLALYREEKETPGYQILVDTKGVKMKESAGSTPPFDGGTAGKRSGPNMHIDFGGSQVKDYRIVASMQSMTDLAATLEQRLNVPVRDLTALTGLYDFQLEFSVEDVSATGSGPTPGLEALPAALRNQLGLRLDRSKVKLPMLVVERADKTPTAN